MLKIYKGEDDRYSSELIDRPLDHLCDFSVQSSGGDPLVERELVAAMELISEVFNLGPDEVRKMIKDRMARRGIARPPQKEVRKETKKEKPRSD
jgi:hypothetical protein